MSKEKRIPVAWMKVYDAHDNFLASCACKYSAAAVVALAGEGANIRNGHAKRGVIWREGSEKQSAMESFDFVEHILTARTTAGGIE